MTECLLFVNAQWSQPWNRFPCRNWNHLGVPLVMGDRQVTMRFSTHHVGISIWTSQFCGHIIHVYPRWIFDGSSLGKGLGCLGVFLASNWLTKCRGISLVAETIARSLKFGSQLTCEKTPGSHIYPLDVSNRIFFRFRKASIQQMQRWYPMYVFSGLKHGLHVFELFMYAANPIKKDRQYSHICFV